ncbi:MAG: alpha/beta hydrolase [Exilibacterium sp.]
MAHKDTRIQSEDGIQLFVRSWPSRSTAKAVVQVVHGMSEHCLRYARFAEFLNNHNIAVIAHDQRGHGKTATNETMGLFSETGGWEKVIGDVDRVRQFIDNEHPQLPVILLGHSMGSFIVQSYLINYRPSLAACLLSGSNFNTPPTLKALRQIARFERWRQGKTGHSRLINWLSFGTFNNAFKPNRTKSDWLSKDEHQVDLYVNDPLCGQKACNQLWIDLVEGLLEIAEQKNLQRIPSTLPIFIFGGENDPVSAGNRLTLLAEKLKQAGIKTVDLKVYPNGRHEMLNETNCAQVYEDLSTWITRYLP